MAVVDDLADLPQFATVDRGQLETLAKMMAETSDASQRRLLLDQAEMIQRASERSVAEASDRDDVRRRFEAVLTAEAGLARWEAA